MIVVAGTKRSGTSLWMQILERGGFTILGQKFPSNWETTIKAANPHGFYETKFRMGINWTTNPDSTGHYFRSDQTKEKVVKIFMGGVVRTELAYLDCVVVTTRHWAEYAHSIRRLYKMELEHAENSEGADRETKIKALTKLINYPVEYEWFFENYEFVRDFTLRRYSCNVATYEMVLSKPEETIQKVFGWLGKGDVKEAVKAIDPELAKQKIHRPALNSPHAEVMDEFYAAIQTGTIPNVLIEKLNDTAKKIRVELKEMGSQAPSQEERNAIESVLSSVD